MHIKCVYIYLKKYVRLKSGGKEEEKSEKGIANIGENWRQYRTCSCIKQKQKRRSKLIKN